MFERILEAIGLIIALVGMSSIPGCLGSGCLSSGEDPWPPERSADDYTADVSRSYFNAEEKRMLELAEAADPPRDDLAAMAAIDPKGIPNAEIPATGAWWYAVSEGIRIPYAVTGDAVTYYTGLIDQWKADPPNATADYASLRYDGGIKYYKTIEKQGAVFEDVYVADMSLSWQCTIYDSTPYTSRSVSFGLARTVVLNAEGKVLYIFGDGQVPNYYGYPYPTP